MIDIARPLLALLLGGAMAAPAMAAPANEQDAMLDAFRTPPQVARPQVWWHWMDGNVSAQGAQLDLDWMERIGIGGVHAFAGGDLEATVVPKPLPFMSPGWRDAYRAAVSSARKRGMDVTIAGSPGWSQTGGPWVPPAQGMKKYVWTETQVEPDHKGPIVLPLPSGVTGPFQAVPSTRAATDNNHMPLHAAGAGPVIAFPTPRDDRALSGHYTARTGTVEGLETAPADLSRSVTLPVGAQGNDIDVDLGSAQTVHALTMAASPRPSFTVLASDDGKVFRKIAAFPVDSAEYPSVQQTFALPTFAARHVRIAFDALPPWRPLVGLPPAPPEARPASMVLRRLVLLSGARIDRFEAKAGFQSIVDAQDAAANAPGIDPGQVIDLTGRIDANGALNWTPPPGRWTILRFGWSLTGQTNGPAEPAATGLEVDKLDAGAVSTYIASLFSLYEKGAGVTLGPSGVNGLLTDSWEAGVQNWTPAILADFRRLRGYDPLPWLPALAGRVVRDTAATQGFLYDWRQTLKDLVVTNHYGVLAKAAHARGMRYYTEVQGDTPRAISDGLTAKSQSDIPTAEFWYRPFATDPGQPSLVADVREAASAAHLYGRPLVAAESLTVAAGPDPWAFSPAMLKPVIDQIFAMGANRILIHDSHHQPFVDKAPGLSLAFFGQFFNRNDTWANQARPWVDYMARTSYLLQQGRYVADIAYVYGEDRNLTQLFEHAQDKAVPAGYGFDYIDTPTLRDHLRMQDGHVIAPGGIPYRVLYLGPTARRLTVPTLRHLEQLVEAGATLVGQRPLGGLGLQSPDKALEALADRLWGADHAFAARAVGKGRVYPTSDLASALKAIGIAPDVSMPSSDATLSDTIMTLHRRSPGVDIYFVTNRKAAPLNSPVTFRVTGRVPEWWSAMDGSIRPLGYHIGQRSTVVDLSLSAQEAGFVVFRRAARHRSFTPPVETVAHSLAIAGPWRVDFQPGRGAPATAQFAALTDWSQSTDPQIRYFSGEATYRKTITVPSSWRGGGHIRMALGQVHELAVVSIDGKEIATAWNAPYAVDLPRNLTPGRHQLGIKVINLWPNRLIGDKQPGAKAIAYAPRSTYRADSPLLPSGLLGPVVLQWVHETAP